MLNGLRKSNRLKLLVRLQCYVMWFTKLFECYNIIFDHPLLTVTKKYMSTHGVQ